MKLSVVLILVSVFFTFMFFAPKSTTAQNDFNRKLTERQNHLSRLKAGRIRAINEYLFNNIKWGSSIETVKSTYPATPLFESNEELNYTYNIGGTKAVLVFKFYYDNLTDIKLIVKTSDNYDIANHEYKKIYSQIISYITEKVGHRHNYSDTLRLRDMKRHHLGNPENIESILYTWNFRSTVIKAEYGVAPGVPIVVTYSKRPN